MNDLPPDPLFYVDAAFVDGQACSITGDEAHHIHKVRRLGAGDRIYLTDGCGNGAAATVEAVRNNREVVTRIDQTDVQEAPRPTITLASAIPRGDRQTDILGMGTQLGMNRYVPLLCERSVTRARPKSIRRWQRSVIEASKQCRQYHFPEILEPMSVSDLLSRHQRSSLVLVADPGGVSIRDIDPLDSGRIQDVLLMVGPEGGFSDAELMAMSVANVLKLRLSHKILRIETAAVAFLAAVNQLEIN